MNPPGASLLRLSLSLLLLLPLTACPEGDSQAPPPFPALPAASAPARAAPASPFLVEPYLQLGPCPASPDRLALVWHAQDGPADWAVETRPQAGEAWTRMEPPVSALADLPGAGPRRVWTAALAPLEPGLPFDYRVLLDGAEVFRAEGMALKGPGQPQRVVVAGGLAGRDDLDADALARQIHQQNPDLMVAAGDLVPPPEGPASRGRSFFSIYNAGWAERGSGAPFMRGTVLVSALGRDAGPAGRLAYRACWCQPQAGTDRWAGQVRGFPRGGPGGACPGPGNFSFRSGDVHWTVLDSSRAVRWSAPGPRAWLARELAGAQSARWRFAVLAPTARDQDLLKSLWPLFVKYRVAIVFAGSLPLPAGPGIPPGPAPARRSACFARLEVTGSRVLCEQVDGRGAASGRFTLSQ